MQASEFHIIKEKQQKELNKLIQTVKQNHFSEKTKKDFCDIGQMVMNATNNLRRAIYQELENFDFEDVYDHNEEKNTNVATNVHSRNTNALKHQISESLSNLARQNKEGIGNGITGPNNSKFSAGNEKFDKFNDAMEINGFKKLIDIINSDEGEEIVGEQDEKEVDGEGIINKYPDGNPEDVTHKLSEEDFENNPDLKKEGLEPGDEVVVSFKDEELYFPKAGATAIPQEKIQKGNKKSEGSRKSKK